MAHDDAAERDTSPGGALTVSIRYSGVEPDGAAPGSAVLSAGRNPIPAIGQLLVGVSELERQLRQSALAHPDDGGFSLTPTVLTAGEPEHPEANAHVATVVLHIRTPAAMPHPGLVQLLTALAEKIAGEAGVECSVDVLPQRPARRLP